MAKNRLSLNFDGMEQLMAKLESLDGDVRTATETALKKSRDYVTDNLRQAIAPHKETGMTEDSLHDNLPVQWSGSVAEMEVGFDIGNGGLASIFLMYGTPKMSPDRKLYNALYGGKTRKQIAEIQQSIFSAAVARAMK